MLVRMGMQDLCAAAEPRDWEDPKCLRLARGRHPLGYGRLRRASVNASVTTDPCATWDEASSPLFHSLRDQPWEQIVTLQLMPHRCVENRGCLPAKL